MNVPCTFSPVPTKSSYAPCVGRVISDGVNVSTSPCSYRYQLIWLIVQLVKSASCGFVDFITQGSPFNRYLLHLYMKQVIGEGARGSGEVMENDKRERNKFA